ncbi:hypothetical protein ACFS5L_02220 [Streptomyces phyllanthi]|uniref:Uncharacterized protein n=2 Tax=Streptomyces phyllanthi TaxID=1803180 RepID=A0A5N8WCG5_9ACTN|nr:hypothetical protein [Streptomyces phyllanthi]
MAVRTTWTVDHACGHQADHDLSHRPADQRAGYARWLTTKDCTDCWMATRSDDSAAKQEWLTVKRAEEQAAATAWATQYDMPPLDGTDKATAFGDRCRHQLMTAAYTTLVAEGAWDEADWAVLEERARTVTAASWWIDQRDADAIDLPELLAAATDTDRPVENPFR